MGLDTSHNCYHGPYSSFTDFRYALADQIDIDLDDYIGYRGYRPTKYLDTIEHDIMPLLNHSDCDGILTVEECKRIANGLTNILDNFNEDINYSINNFKDKIIQFRDGCLEAIQNNEEVEFH